MSRIVVVTGTDTGIGKTWVGCRLAEHLRRRGTEVRAVKLVETGTSLTPGDEEDGVLLARAAGQAAPAAALRRYRTPVAAAEAADREGVPFDLEAVLEETRAIATGAEVTLVEGAGGLLAPLTWDRTIIDVARALEAGALVVAADRLGTINHTLLTVAALEEAGIACLAVVVNPLQATGEDASRGSNAAALRRLRPSLTVMDLTDPAWPAPVAEFLTGAAPPAPTGR